MAIDPGRKAACFVAEGRAPSLTAESESVDSFDVSTHQQWKGSSTAAVLQ